MAALSDESKLFKELQERLEKDGDTRQNFFDCIEVAKKYDKRERLFVLHRIKQLTPSETGSDPVDAIVKIIGVLMNKYREYGFYTSVIEASFD